MRTFVILLFIFTVQIHGQDASGNAVVFNASSTGLANDIIYLQGSGFGATPHVQYSYNDTNWATLTPLASANETVLVQMPPTARLPDLVEVEISPDGYHWSSPTFINQAKALSLDTDRIASGNRFRLFGRNLIFSRTPTVRLVDTASGGSYPATIDTSNSTAYALIATAPAGIQLNHTYSVYVSNGYTGNAASGGEVIAQATLRGINSGNDYFSLGVPWAADLNYTNNVYNVQTDPRLVQHAQGNGSPTDQNAIAEAVNDASNAGGGIVYLPAGTYNLYFQNGCGITLYSRVAVVGQSASNTFVNYGFGPAPGPGTGYAVCFAPNQSGTSDITFTNVNQGGNWPESALAHGSNETFIQRTNWNIASARWIVMEDSTSSTMQNSTLTQGLDPSYNGPLDAASSTQLLLRNNTIKFVAGQLLLNNIKNGVFEGNTIIRDASQHAPAANITHVIVSNFSRDFMLLQNSFQVAGGTLPATNDGETINSEAGGGTRFDEFRGTVQSASGNSITDAAQNFNWSSNNSIPNLRVGAILAIVSGTGTGQWSVISNVSSDGHTVTVSSPWAVPPVAGSRYATFDWSVANWIIAGNTMSDNEKGIDFFDASTRDVLITGNQLTNNSQILISPTEEPTGAGLFNLVLNTQITNNTLSDTNHLRPAAISIVPREDYQNNNFGTAIVGLELRANSITGYSPNSLILNTSFDDSKALTEGINVYWQWQTMWSDFVDDGRPSVLATVIQGNRFNNSSSQLILNSGVYETGLDSNSATNSGNIVDWVVPGATHASIHTVSAGAAPRIVIPSTNAWNQVTIGSLAASTLTPEPASATSFSLPPSLNQMSTSDSLSMLAEQVSGDNGATAKITIPLTSPDASQASVVFRSSASPTSPFVSAGLLKTGEFFVKWRPADGASVSNWQLAMPYTADVLWVKLVKSGPTFQALFSHDGNTWNFGNQFNSVFESSTYLAGLQSFSNAISDPAITFDSVAVLP